MRKSAVIGPAHLFFGKRLILEEEVTTMVDFLDNDDDVDRGW